MFTFNNLNGSSKPNATVASSTNSPSKLNLNTDDTVAKGDNKSNLNTDCTASGSKSDSSPCLFVFGKPDQENSAFKTSEGFNFVFNSNCFDSSSSNSNIESKLVNSPRAKFNIKNNLFDNKEKMEPNVEDKTRAELDSDNNNENSNENLNENSVKTEELYNHEPKKEENVSNEEIVKIIVKEFKDVVNNFVKERIEGERKNAALEARITTLEEEVRNLKTADSKASSKTISANNDDVAIPTVNGLSEQPTEQSPVIVSHQKPSPLIPSPVKASTIKKISFGSTSSMFGSSSAPHLNTNSTNTFGSIASSALGNDNATSSSSNFVLGTSSSNPNALTIFKGNELFGASTQNLNQNGKSSEPERKKLFSHEAVTDFLNSRKEFGINSNLKKVNAGNPLKKMANRQESLEQNQNILSKESLELHLQRTIEMSVKKAMEGYWEHLKSNTSEDNCKTFNSNMF